MKQSKTKTNINSVFTFLHLLNKNMRLKFRRPLILRDQNVYYLPLYLG
jgi:hypothetical protein